MASASSRLAPSPVEHSRFEMNLIYISLKLYVFVQQKLSRLTARYTNKQLGNRQKQD